MTLLRFVRSLSWAIAISAVIQMTKKAVANARNRVCIVNSGHNAWFGRCPGSAEKNPDPLANGARQASRTPLLHIKDVTLEQARTCRGRTPSGV